MITPKDGHKIAYSQITKNIYIGSDLCEGGACPIHGEEFAKLGICVEINLEAERREIPPKNIDLYVWIPVADRGVPTLDQLNSGVAVIAQAVQDDNIVYVHCKNGHGRSPYLVAAYFIKYQNLTVEAAISLIKDKRPEIHLEDNQTRELEKFYNIVHDSGAGDSHQ